MSGRRAKSKVDSCISCITLVSFPGHVLGMGLVYPAIPTALFFGSVGLCRRLLMLASYPGSSSHMCVKRKEPRYEAITRTVLCVVLEKVFPPLLLHIPSPGLTPCSFCSRASNHQGNTPFAKEITSAHFYYLNKFLILTSGNLLYLYKYHIDTTQADDIRRLDDTSFQKVKPSPFTNTLTYYRPENRVEKTKDMKFKLLRGASIHFT